MDETRPTTPPTPPEEPGGVATKPPPPPTIEVGSAPPPSSAEWQPTASPPRRSGPVVVLATVLIAIGVLSLLATYDVGIPWEIVLPAAVIVVGLGLLAGVRTGSHGGLIVLGVFLTLFASAAVVIDGPISLRIGDRAYRPDTAAEVASEYGLGMGTMTVDLRGVDFAPGTVALDVHVAMGDLVLRVPDGVRVDLHASAAAGDLQAYDRSQSGLGPDIDEVFGPADATTTLEVDASVVFGSVEVRP